MATDTRPTIVLLDEVASARATLAQLDALSRKRPVTEADHFERQFLPLRASLAYRKLNAAQDALAERVEHGYEVPAHTLELAQ